MLKPGASRSVLVQHPLAGIRHLDSSCLASLQSPICWPMTGVEQLCKCGRVPLSFTSQSKLGSERTLSGEGLSGCLHKVHLVLSIFLPPLLWLAVFLFFSRTQLMPLGFSVLCLEFTLSFGLLSSRPCSYREHFNSLEETRDQNA